MEKILKEETMEEKTRIFVYGSLLKGLGNHGCLDGQQLEGVACTEAEYTMVSLGGFPGLHEDGETAIVGETYLVDAAGMVRVNRLEGVNEEHPESGLYRREDIHLDDGSVAVGYIYNGDRGDVVESGDWRQYRANNRRMVY
jgi:gamma-glutamylcyclotransferase (GGCT)/AIG2-like uncharacterized protein YtfP